ncbi:hypothetical protein J7643_09860 [bacterium]|nr:hypothetical protein [bacterium]
MRGRCWRGLSLSLLLVAVAGCAAAQPGDVRSPEKAPPRVLPHLSAMPGEAGSGPLVQPQVLPAPGGRSTAYPAGTVFATGTVRVTIGPGGVVTPAHIYLRPNTTTIITNQDSVTRTFVGFGGATDVLGPIAPGESFTKGWHYPGTWSFRDASTPNAPTFTVTDVPE